MGFDFIKNKMLNNVKLTGVIIENPKSTSKEHLEEISVRYFETKIAVQRRSGYVDEIILVLRDNPINRKAAQKGNIVYIEGYKNSKNIYDEGKNKLIIYVSVKKIEVKESDNINYQEDVNPNSVELEGFICKAPTFRQTPQGRYISDAMLAISRPYPSNKTDYIPIIGWGTVAERMADLSIGTKILVKGRIQSREYEKKKNEGDTIIIEKKIAYEVSVNEFSLIV